MAWDFPFGSGGAAYMVCVPWPVPGVAPRGDGLDSPLGVVLPLPYPRLRLEYGWRDMRHHASKLLCHPHLGCHHMSGGMGRWQGWSLRGLAFVAHRVSSATVHVGGYTLGVQEKKPSPQDTPQSGGFTHPAPPLSEY